MENLTHSLMGLAVSKAGLERLSPGATAVCIIAANAPDADIVTVLGGRWAYLHHHRGITHSILGTLALALLIPAVFYLIDVFIARFRRRQSRIRLPGLLLASTVASATHPLMDWTNNYGVRPLLPWNGQWFYGDLVYILDPWLWLILGGAAFLLTSGKKWQVLGWAALALVLSAALVWIPMQRADAAPTITLRLLWFTGLAGLIFSHLAGLARRYGSAIALVALSFVVVYWGALALAHKEALIRTEVMANTLASQNGERLLRIAAMPTLANPLRWQSMAETDRATYRFFSSSLGANDPDSSGLVRYQKPEGKALAPIAAASRERGAQVFLEFARFPVFQVQGDCATQALVQLADLRYTEPGATRGTFSLEVPVACPPEEAGATNNK